MFALMTLAVAVAQCCAAGVHAGEMDHAIHVRSSVHNTSKIANDGILRVPSQECGYILCNASAVFDNLTNDIHYWDYYVEWEMPKEAKADEAIFQMGRDYQLPHSYLVFRHFRSNLTGMYKCRLLFRQAQVGSHIVHLSLDESTHSSRICPH
ncbi:uncharacterized protein LOC126987635 [Eriocheir sinensis]|uniref:uncharacterized protein LOC126987635 n=1 Tax=Eriocheir sinensis TaxID=95602 RepID=UPI0021C61B4D|nr:uncharacterized protein LOC126987635 [Eriocheir sinensis]